LSRAFWSMIASPRIAASEAHEKTALVDLDAAGF
jgi:hypothetical protein